MQPTLRAESRRTRRALLGGTAAALAHVSRTSAQAAPLALRVGADTGWEYSEAWFAQDMGFFTKAGLNVAITALNSGAAISAAVASGQLDVGVSSIVPLAIAYTRGLPFVVIAGGALETANVPGGVLCVAKDGPIQRASDLQGKTIAVNALKNLAEMVLDAWLTKNGVDLSSVKVVELRYTEMEGAIDRGAIAGAVLSEPALTPALKSGRFRVLGDMFVAIGSQYTISCWFSTRPFAQKNPEAIRRFQTAIYDAGRWANTHPDESGTVNAKYAQMDPEVVKKMLRRPYATQLRPVDLAPVLEAASKYGVTPQAVAAADLIWR